MTEDYAYIIKNIYNVSKEVKDKVRKEIGDEEYNKLDWYSGIEINSARIHPIVIKIIKELGYLASSNPHNYIIELYRVYPKTSLKYINVNYHEYPETLDVNIEKDEIEKAIYELTQIPENDILKILENVDIIRKHYKEKLEIKLECEYLRRYPEDVEEEILKFEREEKIRYSKK